MLAVKIAQLAKGEKIPTHLLHLTGQRDVSNCQMLLALMKISVIKALCKEQIQARCSMCHVSHWHSPCHNTEEPALCRAVSIPASALPTSRQFQDVDLDLLYFVPCSCIMHLGKVSWEPPKALLFCPRVQDAAVQVVTPRACLHRGKVLLLHCKNISI